MLEKRVRAWGTSVCGRRTEIVVAMVGRDADDERYRARRLLASREMDEESRKHRAIDTLLAIFQLGIVGKTQRRCSLELLTCAGGVGTDLNVLVWKSAAGAASLGAGAHRVRGADCSRAAGRPTVYLNND